MYFLSPNLLTILMILAGLLYFKNKHTLLSVLIGLELITFSAICLYYTPLFLIYGSLSYFIIMFCFAASGAALGLSLLITLIRFSGNDLIKASI